ncbi:hypothetical protein ACFOY2_29460 [Nonomuraea purpurea]|uniref:Transmembrane protein n=1 Tax=Nonomuraea purpurea TaxID=1849276 RepID=A0ABV8GE46_9ACTN
MKPAVGSIARYTRRYRLDGNPLRRRADRLETWALMGAVLLVLIGIWPAILAGRLAYDSALADSRVGPGARQQVAATLLADVPRAQVTFGTVAVRPPQVMARWTAPDGRTHVGYVPAPQLAGAGTAIPLWVGPDGLPATAPVSPAMAGFRGAGVGLVMAMTAASLALTAFLVVRWLLDRRRDRDWDVAWERATPAR